MAGVRIQITIDESEAMTELSALVQRMEDRRALFKVAGQVVADNKRARIMRQQSPDGSPFQPVKASTIKRRMRRRGASGLSILRDFGYLQESINYTSDNDSFSIGTPIEYGAIHRFGGTILDLIFGDVHPVHNVAQALSYLANGVSPDARERFFTKISATLAALDDTVFEDVILANEDRVVAALKRWGRL